MSPDANMDVDDHVNRAFDALAQGDIPCAESLLLHGIRSWPLDSRFRVMNAALAQAQGRRRDAWNYLWQGLAAEPRATLCSREILHTVVATRSEPVAQAKNFALDSGERQVATAVEQIRMDHRARYAFAARWVRRNWPTPRLCTGLDIFCGNGYGSHLVASLSGARMVGIDGSAEAIALAETHYGSHRVVFGEAIHPFTLNGPLFDFAISLESLQHVDDPAGLLQQMAIATDGPFIVSVPNESRLPFARFRHRFEHHVRHFRRDEVLELLGSVGRPRVLAEYGQDVYRIEGEDLAGLLPEQSMHLHAARGDSQFLIMVVDSA